MKWIDALWGNDYRSEPVVSIAPFTDFTDEHTKANRKRLAAEARRKIKLLGKKYCLYKGKKKK